MIFFFVFFCFFVFFFFVLGFTALSRIFHLYRSDRSSKVGENRSTRRKTTWPSVSRTWLSNIWPELGSNHSGEKSNGLRVNSLIHQATGARHKFHDNRPTGSGADRGFEGFYLIWGWRPSWSCDLDPANKLLFPHPMDDPHEILLQSAQWFKRRFENVDTRQTTDWLPNVTVNIWDFPMLN